MAVPSSPFLIFLSVCLVTQVVYGIHDNLVYENDEIGLVYGIGQLPENQITAGPRKWSPEARKKSPKRIQKRRQRSPNLDCQEGNPLGASYLGSVNVTAGGITCQAWPDTFPHEHTDLGNFCRNPDGNLGGVWCFSNISETQWEHCSVPICVSKTVKVLDFSLDNDHEPDSNNELTSATLDAGALPESFTICSAFMVDSWTTEFNSADMFSFLDIEGYPWGYLYLDAASSYTQYLVKLGPVSFAKQTEVVFFPLQWTHACLSLDSNAGKVTLVVDGQLLGEEEYRREEDKFRPGHSSYRSIKRICGGAGLILLGN